MRKGRHFKCTEEERDFCANMPKDVKRKDALDLFYRKFGKRISEGTFINYRNHYTAKTKEQENEASDPYEELAIAIIRQAWDEAIVKISHGKDWKREWYFFKFGFVNDVYSVNGEYFIRKLEEYEEDIKKKQEEAQHED